MDNLCSDCSWAGLLLLALALALFRYNSASVE